MSRCLTAFHNADSADLLSQFKMLEEGIFNTQQTQVKRPEHKSSKPIKSKAYPKPPYSLSKQKRFLPENKGNIILLDLTNGRTSNSRSSYKSEIVKANVTCMLLKEKIHLVDFGKNKSFKSKPRSRENNQKWPSGSLQKKSGSHDRPNTSQASSRHASQDLVLNEDYSSSTIKIPNDKKIKTFKGFPGRPMSHKTPSIDSLNRRLRL